MIPCFLRASIPGILGCLLLAGCASNLADKGPMGNSRLPKSPIQLGLNLNFNSSDKADNPPESPVVQATALQPIAESNPARASSLLSPRGDVKSPDDAAQEFDAPSAPMAMAKLCAKRGQLDEAQKIYAQLLKKNDRDPALHHRLGVVLARQGDFANAARHFEAASQLNPGDPDLLCDMGYAAYLEGRLDEAESHLRRTLQIDANHRKALNNLGLVLGAQCQDAEALKCFQRIMSEAEALANVAYAQSQRGAFRQSQSTYLQSLSLNNQLKPAAQALLQVAEREQQSTARAASEERAEARPGGVTPASPAILTVDETAQPLVASPAVAAPAVAPSAVAPSAVAAAAATPAPAAVVAQVSNQSASTPAASAAVPATPTAPLPAPASPVSIVLQIVAPTASTVPTPAPSAAVHVAPQDAAPAPAVAPAAIPFATTPAAPGDAPPTAPIAAPPALQAPAPSTGQVVLPADIPPAAAVASDNALPAAVQATADAASPDVAQLPGQAGPPAEPQEKLATRMVGRPVISRRVTPDGNPHPSPAAAGTDSAAGQKSSGTTFSVFDPASPPGNSKPGSRRLSELNPLR